MELLKEILQIYMERREWFLELFGQHLKIAGIAIVLAGIMGLLLGIFIAEKEFMAPVILTLANIFYTIPSISLLGILIPFTGIGDKTAIIALTLYGLMPMIRNYIHRYLWSQSGNYTGCQRDGEYRYPDFVEN